MADKKFNPFISNLDYVSDSTGGDLHLDQTTPQTVSGGKPTFSGGIQANSGDIPLAPTDVVLTLKASSTGFALDAGDFIQVRLYSYKTIGGIKYYSTTYTESNTVTATAPNPYVNLTFTAATGADGYLALIRCDMLDGFYVYNFTARAQWGTSSFFILSSNVDFGRSGTVIFQENATVTPNSFVGGYYDSNLTAGKLLTADSSGRVTSDQTAYAPVSSIYELATITYFGGL